MPHRSAFVADETARLLSAWRSDAILDVGALDALRTVLTTSVLLHRRDWAKAVDECPAEVVGAGLDLLSGGPPVGPAADVVMSAVLLHGLSGNPAARLVLDHARARLRREAA